MQWMRICKKVVASLTLVFFIQTHVLLPAVYAASVTALDIRISPPILPHRSQVLSFEGICTPLSSPGSLPSVQSSDWDAVTSGSDLSTSSDDESTSGPLSLRLGQFDLTPDSVPFADKFFPALGVSLHAQSDDRGLSLSFFLSEIAVLTLFYQWGGDLCIVNSLLHESNLPLTLHGIKSLTFGGQQPLGFAGIDIHAENILLTAQHMLAKGNVLFTGRVKQKAGTILTVDGSYHVNGRQTYAGSLYLRSGGILQGTQIKLNKGVLTNSGTQNLDLIADKLLLINGSRLNSSGDVLLVGRSLIDDVSGGRARVHSGRHLYRVSGGHKSVIDESQRSVDQNKPFKGMQPENWYTSEASQGYSAGESLQLFGTAQIFDAAATLTSPWIALWMNDSAWTIGGKLNTNKLSLKAGRLHYEGAGSVLKELCTFETELPSSSTTVLDTTDAKGPLVIESLKGFQPQTLIHRPYDAVHPQQVLFPNRDFSVRPLRTLEVTKEIFYHLASDIDAWTEPFAWPVPTTIEQARGLLLSDESSQNPPQNLQDFTWRLRSIDDIPSLSVILPARRFVFDLRSDHVSPAAFVAGGAIDIQAAAYKGIFGALSGQKICIHTQENIVNGDPETFYETTAPCVAAEYSFYSNHHSSIRYPATVKKRQSEAPLIQAASITLDSDSGSIINLFGQIKANKMTAQASQGMYANISGHVAVYEETIIDTPRWEEVVPQYSQYEDPALDKKSVESINFGRLGGGSYGGSYEHSQTLWVDNIRTGSYLRDVRPTCMMNGSVQTTAENIVLSGAQLTASLEQFMADHKTKIQDLPILLPYHWNRSAGRACKRSFHHEGTSNHIGNNTVASYVTLSTPLSGDISTLDFAGTLIARSVDLTLQSGGHLVLRQTSYDACSHIPSLFPLNASDLQLDPLLLFDPANKQSLYRSILRPLRSVHFDPVLITPKGFVTHSPLPLLYPAEMIPGLLLKVMAQASAHGNTHVSAGDMNTLMLAAGHNTHVLIEKMKTLSPLLVTDSAQNPTFGQATEGTVAVIMGSLVQKEGLESHVALPHLVCLEIIHRGQACLQPYVYLPTQRGTGLFALGPIDIHGDGTTTVFTEALIQGQGGTKVIAGNIGIHQLVQTQIKPDGYAQHLHNPAGICDTAGATHVAARDTLKAVGGKISGKKGATVTAGQASLQATPLSASRHYSHGKSHVTETAVRHVPFAIEGHQGSTVVRIGEGGLETAGISITGQDVVLQSTGLARFLGAYAANVQSVSSKTGGGFLSGSKTVQTTAAVQTLMREFIASKTGNVTFELSNGGDLRALHVSSAGENHFYLTSGKFEMGALPERIAQFSSTKNSRNLAIVSHSAISTFDETLGLPLFESGHGTTIHAGPGATFHLTLPRNGLSPDHPLMVALPQGVIDPSGNIIDQLGQHGGTRWIAELKAQFGDQVVIDYVDERHDHSHITVRSLSPIISAAIGLAVTVATQGMGSSLMLGTAASATGSAAVTAAMCNAAFAGIMSQTALGVAGSAAGDSTAFNKAFSAQALTSLATRIGTAGLQAAALAQFDLGGTAQAFTTKVQAHMLRAAVSQGVMHAMGEGTSATTGAAFAACFAAALAEEAVESIGDIRGVVGSVPHKLLHGIQGAASGTIQGVIAQELGGEKVNLGMQALGGAAGAMLAETLVEQFADPMTSLNDAEIMLLSEKAHDAALKDCGDMASVDALSESAAGHMTQLIKGHINASIDYNAKLAKIAVIVAGTATGQTEILHAMSAAAERAIEHNYRPHVLAYIQRQQEEAWKVAEGAEFFDGMILPSPQDVSFWEERSALREALRAAGVFAEISFYIQGIRAGAFIGARAGISLASATDGLSIPLGAISGAAIAAYGIHEANALIGQMIAPKIQATYRIIEKSYSKDAADAFIMSLELLAVSGVLKSAHQVMVLGKDAMAAATLLMDAPGTLKVAVSGVKAKAAMFEAQAAAVSSAPKPMAKPVASGGSVKDRVRAIEGDGGQSRVAKREAISDRATQMLESKLGRSETKAGKPYNATYIDNQIKGHRAEVMGAVTLRALGYEQLASKLPGNKGIDGVFVKWERPGVPKDIIVVESKYAASGTSKLAKTVDGAKQMDDTWLPKKISEMQGTGDPKVIATGDLLFTNNSLIRRKVNVVDAEGTQRWFKPKPSETTKFAE